MCPAWRHTKTNPVGGVAAAVGDGLYGRSRRGRSGRGRSGRGRSGRGRSGRGRSGRGRSGRGRSGRGRSGRGRSGRGRSGRGRSRRGRSRRGLLEGDLRREAPRRGRALHFRLALSKQLLLGEHGGVVHGALRAADERAA
ncbi:MAG: hypothetical protein CSA65_01855 [Proteobacteria bacterium]|nr:MAG: hypothetical protein CSA65_01855 [Pseudomonadota bacterium]